jgi:hypothetical protein
MTRNRPPLRIVALSAIVALFCTAAFTAGAEAAPSWKFNDMALEGNETTVNHDVESSLTIPSLTTMCNPFVFTMTIWNSSGTGKGEVDNVPLSSCSTSSKSCTVASIAAKSLPWPATLKTVSASDYLVIEGIKLSIFYAGEECALSEIEVVVTGTAGGLIDNATESVTFSPSSFSATGTALKALGQSVSWVGTFTMIGTGAHIGESISA